MGLLEKTFDLLIKKNWIVLLLSFVASIFVIILIPGAYEKIPFSNINVSIIIAIVCITIIIFLALYMILHIINRIRNYLKRKAQKRIEEQNSEEKVNESIEEVKCYFDSLSDFDYNIVMQLIEVENTRPLILKGQIYSDILSRFEWFYIVTSQEPLSVNRSSNPSSIPIPTMQNVMQIKLKPEVYDHLSQIISRTNGLAHIAKKRFLVGEFADE